MSLWTGVQPASPPALPWLAPAPLATPAPPPPPEPAANFTPKPGKPHKPSTASGVAWIAGGLVSAAVGLNIGPTPRGSLMSAGKGLLILGGLFGAAFGASLLID